MFEQFREKWSKAMHPLILRLGDTNPNTPDLDESRRIACSILAGCQCRNRR